jgi:integrase
MHTLPKYLTQDELKRFFNVITSPRDRALFTVIYHYGMRVDEATSLMLDDVDLKNHRIRIRRLKNGVAGDKPLWRHTAKLIRSYLRLRSDKTPYLFTGRKGALQKRQVQHLFTSYAKQAGITGHTVHGLIHTAGNLASFCVAGICKPLCVWAAP